MDFLKSPGAVAIIKSRGMNPEAVGSGGFSWRPCSKYVCRTFRVSAVPRFSAVKPLKAKILNSAGIRRAYGGTKGASAAFLSWRRAGGTIAPFSKVELRAAFKARM